MADDKIVTKWRIKSLIERTNSFEPLPECFNKRLVTALHNNDIGTKKSLLERFYKYGSHFYLERIGPVMYRQIIQWARDEDILTLEERKYWFPEPLFIDRFSPRLQHALYARNIRTEEQVRALMLQSKGNVIHSVYNLGTRSYFELLRYAQDNNWPIYTPGIETERKYEQFCNIISLVGMAVCDMYDNNRSIYESVNSALNDDMLYGDVPKYIKEHVRTCITSIESIYMNK